MARVEAATRTVEAATIMLLRRVPAAAREAIDLSSVAVTATPGFSSEATRQFFGKEGKLWFSAGWQVLLGQSEIQNWVRSEEDQPAVMRWGGEWKFPGGRVEPGETLEQAAWREMREEFGVAPPSGSGVLHLLSLKRTKVIKGVSFLMHNYACLADENPWLAALDTAAIDASLARRRARFEALRDAGGFWQLSQPEREDVAPEVRRVAWLGLKAATECMLSSKSTELRPVDEWQAAEFRRLGVEERDPMFQTMAALLDVNSFDDEDALRARCRESGPLPPPPPQRGLL